MTNIVHDVIAKPTRFATTRAFNVLSKFRKKRREMHFAHLEEEGNLSWKIKLSYCAPTLSTLPIVLLLAVYGTQFYETLGADLAYISFFIALARSFDVISDPLMSYVTDSFRSSYGRRRPFIITGCWVYSFLMIMLLSPPRLDSIGLSLWFGVFYVAFFLASTYTNIPYDALGPELTDNYNDRSRLFFVSGLFDGFGSLVAVMFPVMLSKYISLTTECPSPMDSCYSVTGTGKSCYTVSGTDDYYTYDIAESTVLPYDTYATADCTAMFTTGSTESSSSSVDVINNTNDTSSACIAGLNCFCECSLTCGRVCELENQRSAYSMVGIFFGLWFCITMTNCFWQIKERCQVVAEKAAERRASTYNPLSSSSDDRGMGSRTSAERGTTVSSQDDEESMPPPPMVPSMLNTLKNEPFRRLLPAWACDAVVNGIIASMMTFYVRYVIQPEYTEECLGGLDSWTCDSQLVLGASVTMLLLAAFLSTPIWLFLNQKFGKRRAWLAWSLSMAGTNILYIFLGKGDVMLCILITGINGLPFGAKFLADAILADIIDYDEFLTGARSEATYTMFKSFLPKICAIPASAIPIALLNSVGHIAPVNGVVQPQPDAVGIYVRIVSVILPTCLSLVAFLVKLRFPFKNKTQVDMITEGIGRHLMKEAGTDPVSGNSIDYVPVSVAEQKEIYRLDYFPSLEYVQKLANGIDRNGGGENPFARKILEKTKKRVFMMIFCLSVTAASSISSFSLMLNPLWSFIPVLSIIGVGVSLTGCGFFTLQYKAAKSIVKNPPEKAVILKAIEQRANVEQTHTVGHSTRIASERASVEAAE